MHLAELLTKGFIPKELPPPFGSSSFGAILDGGLPESWKLNDRGGINDSAHLCHYDHRRVGPLRRRLSVPNPLHYYHLAFAVAEHWPELCNFLETSELAALSPTLPRREKEKRAYSPKIPWGENSRLRGQTRRGARWLLRADIARFYPSIYTHSIPWALHTKAIAKEHRNDFSKVGNKLDYWVRMCQDRQTSGIPIGPDTSWVIAEVVNVAIQKELLSKTPSLSGFARNDDYELAFSERADAELARVALEQTLNDFELSLNPLKTSIEALPQPFHEKWRNELAEFPLAGNKVWEKKANLIRYFDLACRHALHSPQDTVLNYALGALKTRI